MKRNGTPTWCGVALAACCRMAAAAGPPHPAAELILEHGRIYTVDGARPWASAVAIGGGRILAVGTDAQIDPMRRAATRIVDLQGRLVTPGLIDSHVHFIDGGWYLRNVPLRDATTLAEVNRRVAQYIANHPKADWVQGEGWSYGYPDLPNGEFRRQMLDKASGAHPWRTRPGRTPRPCGARASRATRRTPRAARSCAAPTASRPDG
jgi:hypothetical protein